MTHTPLPEAAPGALGLDPVALADAVQFAAAHETPWPRDLLPHLEGGAFEPPPDNEVLGPVQPRGAPNGLVMRHGQVAARWGDTRQADMTFSVAKSFLSVLAGLAAADGLISDLDEPVARTVRDGGFESLHNGAITWRHLLTNTSEWEGTLFGKADRIDRYRSLASSAPAYQAMSGGHRKGEARPLGAPGTFWEYNDVRVNRLALALTRRFGRALPEVWRERVMDPLGASDTWRWDGYRTSTVEIDGRPVVSVPGGGHWGGGVVITAEDQARVSQLMLDDGVWHGRRILPEGWVQHSTKPCALNPSYGLLWWLNTDGSHFPAAPRDSFSAQGAGGNICWIDPAHSLVAVLRWVDAGRVDEFIGRLLASVR